MFPAREGQAEVIEPVIERHAGDADAVIAHLGEIGQPQPTRRGFLPEDDVLLGPVQRPPGADAPFQGFTYGFDFARTVVPEPSSGAMMLTGIALSMLWRYRRGNPLRFHPDRTPGRG
jgi:hypothetical protein